MDIRATTRDIVARYRQARYRDRSGAFERFQAHGETPDQSVLIYILPALFGQTEDQQRAWTEFSRALMRLDHPRIVHTLEAAQREGVPYIVAPIAKKARALAAQLTDKPMDLQKAGALISQVGSALEYAGQRGLPHGNLTPEQVLIDEQGEATVGGFGLATLAALAGAASAEPSNPYLSPEQRFSGHAPGTRGDVYALAAILYRLITGRPPDVDPKRTPPAIKLNPTIGPALDKILQQALSPKPQDRYQSADDFSLAMRSALRSPRSEPGRPEQDADHAYTTPAGSVQIPDPLPFPEPVAIPQADLSSLTDATRLAEEMLRNASEAISMPEPLPFPVVDTEEPERETSPEPAVKAAKSLEKR